MDRKKRKTSNQITKDNYDEGENEDFSKQEGPWVKATQKEMEGRKILKLEEKKKKKQLISNEPKPKPKQQQPKKEEDHFSFDLSNFDTPSFEFNTNDKNNDKNDKKVDDDQFNFDFSEFESNNKETKKEGEKKEEAGFKFDFSNFDSPNPTTTTTSSPTTKPSTWEDKQNKRVENLEKNISKLEKDNQETLNKSTKEITSKKAELNFDFSDISTFKEKKEDDDKKDQFSFDINDFQFDSPVSGSTKTENSNFSFDINENDDKNKKEENISVITEKPKEKESKKPKVEVKTGEEDEENINKCRVKLYRLHHYKMVKGSLVSIEEEEEEEEEEDKKKENEEKEKENKNENENENENLISKWKECGVGTLKINFIKSENKARILMRTEKTYKLLLNSYIFPTMIVNHIDRTKQLAIAVIEKGKPQSYTIKFKTHENCQSILKDIEKYKKTQQQEDK